MPPPKSKGGKMLSLINWRLKVTINDGRAFVGQMLAFDRHMNLVLADCEEFRRIRPKRKAGEAEAGPMQEVKRTLGLVILRGETVVSLSVEGPPPVVDEDKKNAVRVVLFPHVPCEYGLARSPLTACFFAGSSRSRTRYAGRSWYGHAASHGTTVAAAPADVIWPARYAGRASTWFPTAWFPWRTPPGMPFPPPPGFGGPPPGFQPPQ